MAEKSLTVEEIDRRNAADQKQVNLLTARIRGRE